MGSSSSVNRTQRKPSFYQLVYKHVHCTKPYYQTLLWIDERGLANALKLLWQHCPSQSRFNEHRPSLTIVANPPYTHNLKLTFKWPFAWRRVWSVTDDGFDVSIVAVTIGLRCRPIVRRVRSRNGLCRSCRRNNSGDFGCNLNGRNENSLQNKLMLFDELKISLI